MSERAKAAKLSEDEVTEATDTSEIEGTREIGDAELKSIAEALIFVADEPLSGKTIADVLKVDLAAVEKAIRELVAECDARNGGLQLREIAGGWQIPSRSSPTNNRLPCRRFWRFAGCNLRRPSRPCSTSASSSPVEEKKPSAGR